MTSIIKRIMSSNQDMLKIGGILTALSLLGKFFGFFRELVVAYYYGASKFVDIYIVAYTLMHLGTAWLQSILHMIVVPQAILIRMTDKKPLFDLFMKSILYIVLFLGIFFSIGIWILFNNFCQYLFKGYNTYDLQIIENLIFILIFFGISRVVVFYLEALFYASDIQIPPRIGTTVQSIVLVSGIIILNPMFGVWSWGIAQSISSIAGVLVLCMFLRSSNLFSLENSRVTEDRASQLRLLSPIIWASIPIIILDFQFIFVQITERSIGSTLDTGTIASMNYAMVIFGFFGLIGEIVKPLLTRFSEQWASKQIEDFIANGDRATRVLGYISIIFCSYLFFFSESIISILFLRGQFTIEDVERTSTALKLVILQAPFIGISTIWYNQLLAMRRGGVYWFNRTISLLVNIIFLYYIGYYGIWGIASSMTIGVILGTISLFISMYFLLGESFSFSFKLIVKWIGLFLVGSLGLLPKWLGITGILYFFLGSCFFIIIQFIFYKVFFIGQELPCGWRPKDIKDRITILLRVKPKGK